MSDERAPFTGFSRPTYTPVPDEVFDLLLPELSKPELKVLLYVIRRTFGWGKDADAISISQLAEGITARDGRVIDRGTGLPRSSVRTATRSLVERGILTVRQVHAAEGDYASNVYALRFQGVGQPPAHPLPANGRGVGQPVADGRPASGPRVGQPVDPQETGGQETVDKKTEIDPEIPLTPEERLALFETRQAELHRLQLANGGRR